MIRVTLDRDSVCAGDSSDPHDAAVEIDAGATVAQLLSTAWKACPLASISGGRATWLIDANGVCIGVAAQQWSAPRLLVAPDSAAANLFRNGAPTLYFRYWCQADPDAVFDAVRAGTGLPPR